MKKAHVRRRRGSRICNVRFLQKRGTKKNSERSEFSPALSKKISVLTLEAALGTVTLLFAKKGEDMKNRPTRNQHEFT